MKYKALILDRDGLLNKSSSDVNSKYYYILSEDDLHLLEGVKIAIDDIKNLDVPVYLATKQRCISKDLIGIEEVNKINEKLETLLDFKFSGIYVEPEKTLKKDLVTKLLEQENLKPNECLYIDDSKDQCIAIQSLGCKVIHTKRLKDFRKCININTNEI